MDFDESTAGMALAGKASGLGQAGWTSGQGRASLGSGLGQAALGWHGPDCLSWAPDPSQPGTSAEMVREPFPPCPSGLGCLLCQVPKNPPALRGGHGGMARQCTSGALTPLPGGRGGRSVHFQFMGQVSSYSRLWRFAKQTNSKNSKCRKNRKRQKMRNVEKTEKSKKYEISKKHKNAKCRKNENFEKTIKFAFL